MQLTPTILILDERGTVIVRMDGYRPPPSFLAALDYAAGHHKRETTLGDRLHTHVHEKANPMLWETIDCPPCDELHRDAFSEARGQVRACALRRRASRALCVDPARHAGWTAHGGGGVGARADALRRQGKTIEVWN